MMTKTGVCLVKKRSQSLGISAVAISCFAVIFLATSCSARTATVVEPIRPPTQGTATKTPARRVMDPAFANAGKNPGLEIWRIENFKPVPYPVKDYGKFYTGDSYIVLNSKKDKNNKFSWDVHFWLGSETSQDEAGSAAILTVQLDDLLNGIPVQHRETQDHESPMFLGYFKNGVRYEQGGVGTGFQHVDVNAAGEKRLFQVKGKRNVRVRQVNLSISSMNKGDCFILDGGNTIYVYVGTGSKRVEKLKAISAANQIRDQDHNGRAHVNIIDDFDTDADKQQFFTVLGSGSPSEVPEESTAEDDAAFETADERSVTLYKVSEQNGVLKVDPISTKPFRQEMLDTNDCFILDTGSAIFVWVGKKASAQEKSQSMFKAQDFIKTKKYPAWTHVNRIIENGESAPFKQYFATWRDYGMSNTRLIRAAMGYESDVEDEEIDVTGFDLLKKSGGRAMGFMPDGGQGRFQKILQFVFHPDTNEVIQNDVTGSDSFNLILGFGSYIFQYNYENKHGQGTVFYVWEGEKALENTRVAAIKFAEKLSDELGNSMVVRMVQGHETRHFLKVFKGKLITTFTAAPTGPQLFRITGSAEDDVRANEVEVDTRSLASDDAFALVLPEKVFIWFGLGASEVEKEMAKNRISEYWKDKEHEIIDEGAEPDEFWEPLGGEGVYNRFLSSGAPILEPRLFHCKILSNGKIRASEIKDYEQNDMDIDDVMLLDGGDELYAWVGEGCTAEEKEMAITMAKEYIRTDPSHRTIETVPIVKLHQGSEPQCFKVMFPSWEDDYWKSIPSYHDVKNQVHAANVHINNQVEK